MTVQQLLAWVTYACDIHDCSLNRDTMKHGICLKQALLTSEPKLESHSYGTSQGERDLAIVLVHTCTFGELCDMECEAHNISKAPLQINTNVVTPRFTLTEAETTPLAESSQLTVEQRESVYRQGIEDRPLMPESYLTYINPQPVTMVNTLRE